MGATPDGVQTDMPAYVNYEVAAMLEDERIAFTRSRPRHCNDNALVEAKSGVVVRHQLGYIYVPTERAEQFNAFCEDHLNPFLNLHRPCLFDTEAPNPRIPGRQRRIHRAKDVQTPQEKLASLADVDRYLPPASRWQVCSSRLASRLTWKRPGRCALRVEP